MERDKIEAISGCLIGCLFLAATVAMAVTGMPEPERSIESLKVADIYTQSNDSIEWELFYAALCKVESNNNPNARGKSGDCGIVQITQSAIDEANRILKTKKYVLEDAFSVEKSREIFDIIQSRHNPNKCMHLALKIWNPRAPLSYHRKVMAEFNRLNEFFL